MPGVRRSAKNAYYFFMIDRKHTLEARGFKFRGGMSDVAAAVRPEWDAMPADEKAYFQDLAKKAKEKAKDKLNATGESFAHVMARKTYEEDQASALERMVDDLTIDSETTVPEKRNFIIIKTIHSCEVLLPRHAFWPLEICIGAFNLVDGMKSHYWTLVDTDTVPLGYARMTVETTDETGLPRPGSKVFEGKHWNYKKIIMNIKLFVEKFLEDYESKYILFAMETDIKSAHGCLEWLSANAILDEKERSEVDDFMKKITFYKLPRLLLRFATVAKRRNDNYNNVMALFNNLEKSAETILKNACFNYKKYITCDFHTQESLYNKRKVCCKNVVVRMIYLIFEEFVPAMLIELKDGHNIKKFRRYSKKRENRPIPSADGRAAR